MALCSVAVRIHSMEWSRWDAKWRPMSVADGKDKLGETAAPRYDLKDAVIYVLTLCALSLLSSLYANLALRRTLGVQFVVGWFSLDLVWSPTNFFLRFHSLAKYASFAVSVALSMVSWWWLKEYDEFLLVQALLALLVAAYWVFTEKVPRNVAVFDRGCVRALGLYGTVTALALIVTRVESIPFYVHPWYCAFVLNSLATTRRDASLLDRALHGWTWGVLLEALSRDLLIFDRFFYE